MSRRSRASDLTEETFGIPRFRGRRGCKDLIVLLRSTLDFGEGPEKSFTWAKWMHRIWRGGVPGDQNDMPVPLDCREEECVLCDMARKDKRIGESGVGDPFKKVYVALIAWLAKKAPEDSKFIPVGQVIPWGFGGDKARQLQPILQGIKASSSDDGDYVKRILRTELIIACGGKPTDETFQKLVVQRSEFPAMLPTALEQVKAALAHAKEEKWLEQMVIPPSNDELRQAVERLLGGGGHSSSSDDLDGLNAQSSGNAGSDAEKAAKQAGDLAESLGSGGGIDDLGLGG